MSRTKRIEQLERKNETPQKVFIIFENDDNTYKLPDGSNVDDQGFKQWESEQEQQHGEIMAIIISFK